MTNKWGAVAEWSAWRFLNLWVAGSNPGGATFSTRINPEWVVHSYMLRPAKPFVLSGQQMNTSFGWGSTSFRALVGLAINIGLCRLPYRQRSIYASLTYTSCQRCKASSRLWRVRSKNRYRKRELWTLISCSELFRSIFGEDQSSEIELWGVGRNLDCQLLCWNTMLSFEGKSSAETSVSFNLTLVNCYIECALNVTAKHSHEFGIC